MSDSERRLAAIAFTDIVGYTALAQRNESLALQILDKHNALVRSVLRQRGGREVKTIGDSFLLEFDSALEAVLCAIEIQTVLREHNKSSDESERVIIRIGIHVGDVVHRGGDVFGDAVNIASRIVPFAEGGGICISEQVYAQVRNKLQYPMIKIPEQPLKNVEQDMNLYQIVLPWGEEEPPTSKSPGKSNRLAILPFANISPDPNDSYFADGLTDELISALSEVRRLRVIARTSVNKYSGTTAKSIAQIGNELQVAFVMEGSVRKAGNKIRVTAQLVDAESQEQIWSNRYDRNLDDVFLIQSDIAMQVVDSLKGTLLKEEEKRNLIERRDTENLAAYVAYLKGRTLLHDRTEQAIRGAKKQFELAIKEDPGFAKAYAGLADIHILLGDYLFAPVPASLEEANAYIKKALELDPNLSEAHVSLAACLMYDYRFAEAEREFRKAITLNPSYATAHHWYANCLEQLGRQRDAFSEVMLAEDIDPLSSVITLSVVYRCIWAGKYDEALKRIRKISEIDPASPLVNEASMVYHFARKDWDNALTYLRRMIEANPTNPFLDMDLAYIYEVTGRKEEAMKLVEKLKAIPDSYRTKGTILAFVYAGLGDFDECFRWLEHAFQNREVFFGWFRSYSLLEDVRRDSRFVQLLKRANLPP